MADTIIIIPCFDEETRLQPTVFVSFIKAHPVINLLFVDDGSTDTTAALIARMRSECPGRVESLTLTENLGKAEAVRRGFLKAFSHHPQLIGFWDADLATPLDQIDVFRSILEGQPKTDMVFGVRNTYKGTILERGFLRRVLGTCFASFIAVCLRLPVYDTQCGAKLFRMSKSLQRAFERPFVTTWLFDIEIYARMLPEHAGAASPIVHGQPIPHWKDVPQSKLRLYDYLLSAVQFFRLAWTHPTLWLRGHPVHPG